MGLRGLFRFQNADSTKDLNDRFSGLVLKGVLDPGATHSSGATGITTQLVMRVPGQLAVDVVGFMAVGSDGMVVVNDAPPNSRLAVTAGITQYVLVKSVYGAAGPAETVFEVLSSTDWAALLTSEKAKRIILAKIVLGAGATEVLDADINLTENDIIDKFDRYFIRGVVAAAANLPLDTGTLKRVKTGDVYLSIAERQFYRFDGTAWQTVTDGAIAISLDNHLNVLGPTSSGVIARDPQAYPAHPAAAIRFDTTGTFVTSTQAPNYATLQQALVEIDTEKAKKAGDAFTGAITVAATGNDIAVLGTGIGTGAGVKGIGGSDLSGAAVGAPGLWGVGGNDTTFSSTGGTGTVARGGTGSFGGVGIDAAGAAGTFTGEHSGGQGIYTVGGATTVGGAWAGHGVETRGGNASGATAHAGHGLLATGGNASGVTSRDGHGVLARAGAGGALKAIAVVAMGPGSSPTIPSAADAAGLYSVGGNNSNAGLYSVGGDANGAGAVLLGTGAGDGVIATGGAIGGDGGTFTGGSTGGLGARVTGTGTSHGMVVTTANASSASADAGHGITTSGGAAYSGIGAATGAGGHGIVATGGAGSVSATARAAGHGLMATGGFVNSVSGTPPVGAGVHATGSGTSGGTAGPGVIAVGGNVGGDGVQATANGTGTGVIATGATGLTAFATSTEKAAIHALGSGATVPAYSAGTMQGAGIYTKGSTSGGIGVYAEGGGSSSAIYAVATNGASTVVSNAGTGLNDAAFYGSAHSTANSSYGVVGYAETSTGAGSAGVRAIGKDDGTGQGYALSVAGEHAWSTGHQAQYRKEVNQSIAIGGSVTVTWDSATTGGTTFSAGNSFQKGLALDSTDPRETWTVPRGRYLVSYTINATKSDANAGGELRGFIEVSTAGPGGPFTTYNPSIVRQAPDAPSAASAALSVTFLKDVTATETWKLTATTVISAFDIQDANLIVVRLPV